jgi:hypothetical protein
MIIFLAAIWIIASVAFPFIVVISIAQFRRAFRGFGWPAFLLIPVNITYLGLLVAPLLVVP